MTVSPTYVPDLVHTCLDLAVDRESGVWHLNNGGEVTWFELARMAAERAGIDASGLVGLASNDMGMAAARPRYSVLHSERAILLPRLENALDRFIELRNVIDPEYEELVKTAESRQQLASGHRQQEETAPEALAGHF
jgi:dTDP-4-dehydrorhamnose reductase